MVVAVNDDATKFDMNSSSKALITTHIQCNKYDLTFALKH